MIVPPIFHYQYSTDMSGTTGLISQGTIYSAFSDVSPKWDLGSNGNISFRTFSCAMFTPPLVLQYYSIRTYVNRIHHFKAGNNA
jgi:hypothetical protein